jgi:hypothetical protein
MAKAFKILHALPSRSVPAIPTAELFPASTDGDEGLKCKSVEEAKRGFAEMFPSSPMKDAAYPQSFRKSALEEVCML